MLDPSSMALKNTTTAVFWYYNKLVYYLGVQYYGLLIFYTIIKHSLITLLIVKNYFLIIDKTNRFGSVDLLYFLLHVKHVWVAIKKQFLVLITLISDDYSDVFWVLCHLYWSHFTHLLINIWILYWFLIKKYLML